MNTTTLNSVSFSFPDSSTLSRENSSISSKNDSKYDRNVNMSFSLAYALFASIFLSYILMALCCYSCKTTNLKDCCKGNSTKRQQNQSAINCLLLAATFFGLIYAGLALPLILAQLTKIVTLIIYQLRVITFGLTFFLIYFVLWFRGHTTIYANPLLKDCFPKWLHVLHKGCLMCLVIVIVGNSAIFLMSHDFGQTDSVSMDAPYATQPMIKYFILIATTSCFQIALLFSFLYPLYMHRRRMLSRGFDSSITHSVLKRTVIITSVCVVTDITAFVWAVLDKDTMLYVRHLGYSPNEVVNIFGVICAFANWKKRLFPFKKCGRNDPINQSTDITQRE